MRIYNGYKKHYQYQILVNLLLLLFLFIVIAFVIKNYFKPFLSIIILLIICTPIYDLMKKVFQKNEIAGALTMLVNARDTWHTEQHAVDQRQMFFVG